MSQCNVWCVRAASGQYTENFIKGNYIAIGWNDLGDLSSVKSREELQVLYEKAYKDEKSSKTAIGQQVGQIHRFLLEIKEGDYVITPSLNTENLRYGRVESAYYYSNKKNDGCPKKYRRSVKWDEKEVNRGMFSVPFQNTIRSSLTVFSVSEHHDEFLTMIGKRNLVKFETEQTQYDAKRVVLEQILKLGPKDFEILVQHLLSAMGFDGLEVTGRPNDGGVDLTGEFNISNLVKIKIFAQVKRYKLNSKISNNTVKQLRSSIPRGGQGIFVTTADYQKKAIDTAIDPKFPRIGLIKGSQLVDLLVEYWDDLPKDLQKQLDLERGLVQT